MDRRLSSTRSWSFNKPPSPQPVLGLRNRAPQNLLGQAAVVCQQFPDWQVWPKMCSDSQLVHVRAGMLQNCTCLHLTERSHFKPGPCCALFPLVPELRPPCCQLRPPPGELCTQSTPYAPSLPWPAWALGQPRDPLNPCNILAALADSIYTGPLRAAGSIATPCTTRLIFWVAWWPCRHIVIRLGCLSLAARHLPARGHAIGLPAQGHAIGSRRSPCKRRAMCVLTATCNACPRLSRHGRSPPKQSKQVATHDGGDGQLADQMAPSSKRLQQLRRTIIY